MPSSLLLQLALKAVIVLGATWAVTAAMKRCSASARHMVWALGVVATLALPMVRVVGPTWTVSVPESLAQSAVLPLPRTVVAPEMAVPVAAPSSDTPVAAVAGVAAQQPIPDSPSPAVAAPVDWIRLTGLVWMLGVAFGLLRLVLGMERVRRIARRATPIVDEAWLLAFDEAAAALRVDRRVSLKTSDRTSVPVACGIWHPAVLMPAAAAHWTSERRMVVLLHELAHVRRRDCLTQTLAHVMCALHWMNPLAYVALKRLRAEQERACDDLVLASGTAASSYADHLLEIARAFRSSGVPAWATLAMARPSQLEGRLMAILDDDRDRRPFGRRTRLAVAAFTVVTLMALGALHVTAASDSPANTSVAVSVESDSSSVPTSDSDSSSASASESSSESASGTHEVSTNGVETVRVDPLSITVNRSRHSESPSASPAPSPSLSPAPSSSPAVVPEQGGRLGSFLDLFRPAQAASQAQAQTPAPPAPAARPASPQAAPVSDETRRRVADALMTALNDANADVREQALNGLASMRDARAIPALLKALKDPSVELRERAVSFLAQFDTPEALDGLAGAMKDGSPQVRQHAVRHVGAKMSRGLLADGRYTETFIALLRDQQPDIREAAADALGDARATQAVPALSAALKDQEKDVREAAARSLGRIADPAAIDALTAALKDADPEVRERAAMALGQIARGQRRDRSGVRPVPPVPPVPPRPIAGSDFDFDFDFVFDFDFDPRKIEMLTQKALQKGLKEAKSLSELEKAAGK